MSAQADAIRLYFEANGIKLKDVADALGIKPPCVSNMLAGRDKIGKNRAKKLHELYGFSYKYLVTGEGSLLDPDEPVAPKKLSEAPAPSSPVLDNCPSIDDLLHRIKELSNEVEKQRKENDWLRSLVDRLAPDGK